MPALLIGADTGDVAWSASKHDAVDHAIAALARGRAHWFSPAHHDVHAQQPDAVAALLHQSTTDPDFFPGATSTEPSRMNLPRLLVIMGSGETAPTMKTPHRARLRAHHRRAATSHTPVMLDTPFGFQENAPILAASTTKYFSDSVGQDVAVAGLERTDTGDSAAIEAAMARIRDANWVFAGPGSPTFALRQWQRTGLRDVLAEKLRATDRGGGGALVFSSAAALTLGVSTVPVYEIYKVGMDPWWEPGLDLLSGIGISAAVIPHYDNQEGGNHDTRFCYLGERRLSMLEPELPDGAFVLGLDEHTGVIIDLDADTAEIVGKGGLTLRVDGESVRHEAGTTLGARRDPIRRRIDDRHDRR